MAGVPDYSKHANEIEEEVVKVKPDLKSVRNKFREKEPMTAENLEYILVGVLYPSRKFPKRPLSVI